MTKNSKFILLCLLHSLTKAISIIQFNSKAYTVVKIFSQHMTKQEPTNKRRRVTKRLTREKNRITENFIRKLWKIKHDKKFSFIAGKKKHFHLTFIHYVVQITLSWHKALAGKSMKRAKNNPFLNRRNNIVIVYCLIWIHRANTFSCYAPFEAEGLAEKIKKQLSLSCVGWKA